MATSINLLPDTNNVSEKKEIIHNPGAEADRRVRALVKLAYLAIAALLVDWAAGCDNAYGGNVKDPVPHSHRLSPAEMQMRDLNNSNLWTDSAD